MEYRKWIIERELKAKDELNKAHRAVLIAEFGVGLFTAVYDLTMNDKFACQIATEFDFDRILLSKEFTDEEKNIIKEFQENYKIIAQ